MFDNVFGCVCGVKHSSQWRLTCLPVYVFSCVLTSTTLYCVFRFSSTIHTFALSLLHQCLILHPHHRQPFHKLSRLDYFSGVTNHDVRNGGGVERMRQELAEDTSSSGNFYSSANQVSISSVSLFASKETAFGTESPATSMMTAYIASFQQELHESVDINSVVDVFSLRLKETYRHPRSVHV